MVTPSPDRRNPSNWRRATDQRHAARIGDLLHGLDTLVAKWDAEADQWSDQREQLDWYRGELEDLLVTFRSEAP